MPNIAHGKIGEEINAGFRAVRAWQRINRSPTAVEVVRNKEALTAQTVRIEISNGGSNVGLPTGTVGVQSIVIYGVKGHPNPDVSDTDLRRSDRVVWNGKEYTIETIVTPPGEIQGFGVARA